MREAKASKKFVGILTEHRRQGRDKAELCIQPCNKKLRSTYYPLDLLSLNGAKVGDIVVAERSNDGGSSRSKVTKVLGREDTPHIYALISQYEQGLTVEFSEAALKQARSARITEADFVGRKDFRHLDALTIDPKSYDPANPNSTNGDFDDIIYSETLPDGGRYYFVGIADVAHFVRPGDALDQESYERGNSTYYPGFSVPMLPRELSSDLCSLKPGVDRLVIGYEWWTDKDKNVVKEEISRGIVRSRARLTYEQAQAARNGNPDAMCAPLMHVINDLYEGFSDIYAQAKERGMLELGGNEDEIVLGPDGKMTGFLPEDDSLSHEVVAQLMITANSLGDRTLTELCADVLHRYHAGMSERKEQLLYKDLAKIGVPLYLDTYLKNRKTLVGIIENANKLMPAIGKAVCNAVKMSQSKAYYDPTKNGHDGLALPHYGHHTSPIRRRSDLFNQRSLITALGLGEGGLSDHEKTHAQEIANHISNTEVTSNRAEQAAEERFIADYYSRKTGEDFDSRVLSVDGGGVYVRLEGTNVDGPVSLRSLAAANDNVAHSNEKFDFNPDAKILKGISSGKTYVPGDKITVRVEEANGLMGSIRFAPVANDNAAASAPAPEKAPKARTRINNPQP